MTVKTATLAEKFAANFTKLQADRKMTQSAIAKKAGISLSYVSMLQRGARTPPLNMVDQIAQKLGVEALDLLK